MKIGFDTQIANSIIERLKTEGYDVVVKAMPGETDISWFQRGRYAGMSVAVSPDNDIKEFCEYYGINYFNFKPLTKMNKNDIFNYIVTNLKRIENELERSN